MKNELGLNVWTDGCYDMVHYGHANQLRQAKKMGKHLIVGIHSDEEILLNKGKTIFNIEERYIVCMSIRWVDQVICGVPYTTTIETLDKYNCQFCVHGDDITLSHDGNDTYAIVKKCGRYKECHRTISVSTTDLLNRMLGKPMLTNESALSDDQVDLYHDSLLDAFRENLRPPQASDNVVYTSGCFEILHPGLVEFFKTLKTNNSFVLVGIYSDDCILNEMENQTYLNAKERTLSIIACKYVDWVIVNAPYAPSVNFIEEHFISKVYPGDCDEDPVVRSLKYKNIIDANILQPFDAYSQLSSTYIIDRVRDYSDEYIVKLKNKVPPSLNA